MHVWGVFWGGGDRGIIVTTYTIMVHYMSGQEMAKEVTLTFNFWLYLYFPGTSPVSHQQFPRQQKQPLVVEEFDTPPSSKPPLHTDETNKIDEAFIPNKVLVQGFPDETQEFVLQLYLQSLTQSIECTEVVLHGKLAVATFAGALGTFLIPTSHQ